MNLEERMENFFATCRQAGVKMTHQRIEIFREVALSSEHPDATVVYENLRAKMPSLSLDTVYRTLWLLCDLGLIKTLGVSKERTRFDANLDHHHHFVCDKCKLTKDFTSNLFDQLPEPIDGFGVVTETRVEVHGICKSCM